MLQTIIGVLAFYILIKPTLDLIPKRHRGESGPYVAPEVATTTKPKPHEAQPRLFR